MAQVCGGANKIINDSIVQLESKFDVSGGFHELYVSTRLENCAKYSCERRWSMLVLED